MSKPNQSANWEDSTKEVQAKKKKRKRKKT